MSYKVLIAPTIVELVQQVNEAINEGWWPQGGIAVSTSAYYFQAMVHQPPSIASLKQAADELAALRGASKDESVRQHRDSILGLTPEAVQEHFDSTEGRYGIESRIHDGFGQ